MSKKGDFLDLDGSKYIPSSSKDAWGLHRNPGEIWKDRAGHECYFRENGSISCKTVNNDPTMTIQSEGDVGDVNKIVERFGLKNLSVRQIAGNLTQLGIINPSAGKFGDFTNAVDLHTSILRVQKAQEAFMEFPAAIRARFDNDPGKLIDFLADTNNRSEAIELGLIAPPQDAKVPQGDAIPPSQEGG